MPVYQESSETISVKERLEQKESKKENISPYSSEHLSESSIPKVKELDLDNEKSIGEAVDDLDLTKKYKDKEDLDIPTFLRKKYKRF
jgi:hypothetical protein